MDFAGPDGQPERVVHQVLGQRSRVAHKTHSFATIFEGFNLVVVAFSGAHGDIPPEDGMATPAGEYTDARMSQMPE